MVHVHTYRKVINVEGESCLLDIIDTAGDPLFDTHTESKIREGDGFLCLFPMDQDNLDNFERALEFLLNIKMVKKGTKPCIILVGTKYDKQLLQSKVSTVTRHWAQFYDIPYIETSSKLNMNVDKVFYGVVALLRQNKQARVQEEEEKISKNCCSIC